MENGKIIRGLAGVPCEGPVLLVGYHMLMGLEVIPLVEQYLRQKKILLRGIAHPTLFTQLIESETNESSIFDMLRLYGATPVTASNFFKLLATKSHVLLYPGGAREALHRKVRHNLPLVNSIFYFNGKPCTIAVHAFSYKSGKIVIHFKIILDSSSLPLR